MLDEVVESWKIEDASEEELFAALDEVRANSNYSDEITIEEILEILRSEM